VCEVSTGRGGPDSGGGAVRRRCGSGRVRDSESCSLTKKDRELKLLPLDDPRWPTYRSGYRLSYDVVPLIRQLQQEGASKQFWETVWDELHHQGDVGEATYALIPYLVDYQSGQSALDEQLFHFCVVVDLAQPESNKFVGPGSSASPSSQARGHSRCEGQTPRDGPGRFGGGG
jgi:hypothetical protein